MTIAELTTFITTPEFFSGAVTGLALRKAVRGFAKRVLNTTDTNNNG